MWILYQLVVLLALLLVGPFLLLAVGIDRCTGAAKEGGEGQRMSQANQRRRFYYPSGVHTLTLIELLHSGKPDKNVRILKLLHDWDRLCALCGR